jgi:hypothetical protein
MIVSLVIAKCKRLPFCMYQYFTAGTLTLLLVTEFIINIAHIVLCICDRKRVLYKLILILDGIVFAGCMLNALLNTAYPDGLPIILPFLFGLAAVI